MTRRTWDLARFHAFQRHIEGLWDPERELKVANVFSEPVTDIDGPGACVLCYLAICLLDCPGCWNAQLNGMEWLARTTALDGRPSLRRIDDLLRALLATGADAVTFLGGEPLLQHRALRHLCAALQKAGTGVVLYTGGIYEELLRVPGMRELFADVDILVDGPFDASLRAPLLWRGSSNQRVHFLTDRYRSWEARVNEPSPVAFAAVYEDGVAHVTRTV